MLISDFYLTISHINMITAENLSYPSNAYIFKKWQQTDAD